jgi:hypothetical protein
MLIGEAIGRQLNAGLDVGWFDSFSRVLIKDSSEFEVSENLASELPGIGGNSSQAGVSIQYEFDLKSGSVNDLSINAATRSDRADAKHTIQSVMKDDLIIRDLGYSIIHCFKEIMNKSAFFISRLDTNAGTYEKNETGTMVQLDFGKLEKSMKEQGIKGMEKQVYIGKTLLPVRLIIELMPEEVVSRRRRKTNRANRSMGRKTSDRFKERSSFNLFITNIEATKLTAEAIADIYRSRWQIELCFKLWKGTFGIDKMNPMKIERLMCLLKMRLLMILINWEIFAYKRHEVFQKTHQLLSMIKSMKTLQENTIALKEILINQCKGLARWIRKISEMLDSHHWLEKKKNKLGLAEILSTNVL